MDYSGWESKKAIEHRFKSAMAKTERQYFPNWTLGLYDYQKKLEENFLADFLKGADWAVCLGEALFKNGREKNLAMDEAIRKYAPKFEKDAKYKKDTVEYIEGKKFEEYAKLLER